MSAIWPGIILAIIVIGIIIKSVVEFLQSDFNVDERCSTCSQRTVDECTCWKGGM